MKCPHKSFVVYHARENLQVYPWESKKKKGLACKNNKLVGVCKLLIFLKKKIIENKPLHTTQGEDGHFFPVWKFFAL